MVHHSLRYTLLVQGFFFVVGVALALSKMPRRRMIGFVLMALSLVQIGLHWYFFGWR